MISILSVTASYSHSRPVTVSVRRVTDTVMDTAIVPVTDTVTVTETVTGI